MRRLSFLACMSVLLLTACASAPSSSYYTLRPVAAPQAESVSSSFAISVPLVEIPEQVDRPQIVLSNANGTQVTLLNDSLWAAPLANEIRDALAQRLSQRLGVLELAARDAPKTLPLWVLDVTVQRFESIYGGQAVLEATWRQTPRQGAEGATAICRALITIPVQEGIPALVSGHQQALDKLSGLMADTLKARPVNADAQTQLKGCA